MPNNSTILTPSFVDVELFQANTETWNQYKVRFNKKYTKEEESQR